MNELKKCKWTRYIQVANLIMSFKIQVALIPCFSNIAIVPNLTLRENLKNSIKYITKILIF